MEKTKLILLQMKEKDIKVEGVTYKVTGNWCLFDDYSEAIIETEDVYKHKTERERKLANRYLFKNSVILSLNQINEKLEFVEKIRPENFVSSDCTNEFLEMKNLIKSLQILEEKRFSKKLKLFDLEGGITFYPKDNDIAFALNKPKNVKLISSNFLKRLKLDSSVLRRLVEDSDLRKSFFKEIDDDMKKIGCIDYIFRSPNYSIGTDAFLYNDFYKEVEMRIYGVKIEDLYNEKERTKY